MKDPLAASKPALLTDGHVVGIECPYCYSPSGLVMRQPGRWEARPIVCADGRILVRPQHQRFIPTPGALPLLVCTTCDLTLDWPEGREPREVETRPHPRAR